MTLSLSLFTEWPAEIHTFSLCSFSLPGLFDALHQEHQCEFSVLSVCSTLKKVHNGCREKLTCSQKRSPFPGVAAAFIFMVSV